MPLRCARLLVAWKISLGWWRGVAVSVEYSTKKVVFTLVTSDCAQLSSTRSESAKFSVLKWFRLCSTRQFHTPSREMGRARSIENANRVKLTGIVA